MVLPPRWRHLAILIIPQTKSLLKTDIYGCFNKENGKVLINIFCMSPVSHAKITRQINNNNSHDEYRRHTQTDSLLNQRVISL